MGNFNKEYFYGKRRSNYSNYGKIDPYRKFKKIISFIEELEISGRYLDAGCAFGLLLNEVRGFFGELHGFDISKYAIGKAIERTREVDLKVLDLNEGLPYHDESFDCITALDILEHTNSFSDSLGRLTAKLKRGGYMIISSPLNEWPQKLFGFLDRDDTHISIPKESEIKDIVKQHRLTIIKEEKYAALPNYIRLPFIPAVIELYTKKEVA